jgi:hypothetical protein
MCCVDELEGKHSFLKKKIRRHHYNLDQEKEKRKIEIDDVLLFSFNKNE